MVCASNIQGASHYKLDHFKWMFVLESHLSMHGNVFSPCEISALSYSFVM